MSRLYFSYHLYALFSLNSNKELLVEMRVFEGQGPFKKTYSNEHYDIIQLREYIYMYKTISLIIQIISLGISRHEGRK